MSYLLLESKDIQMVGNLLNNKKQLDLSDESSCFVDIKCLLPLYETVEANPLIFEIL